MVKFEVSGFQGKNKVKVVRGGQARSVVSWIQGIRTGRLEQRINGYYDNIKELDLSLPPEFYADPWKMNRLEQISRLSNLEKFIVDGRSTENISDEAQEDAGGDEASEEVN